MIFKRNNNNINSSKSSSLINKNKSPLNRPKSYEYKPNYIINNKNKDKIILDFEELSFQFKIKI